MTAWAKRSVPVRQWPQDIKVLRRRVGDETDNTRKHPEFVSTHKPTGLLMSVEAHVEKVVSEIAIDRKNSRSTL